MIYKIQNKKIFASDGGRQFSKEKHTVVLIHGSGLSHIVWSLTEHYLSNQGYNVLSLDLPGHGNSEGDCLDSIEKIADWLDTNRFGNVFSDYELVQMVTSNPADGMNWGDYVGRIKAGLHADLMVVDSFRVDPYRNLIESIDPDVKLTIVGGLPIFGCQTRRGRDRALPLVTGQTRCDLSVDCKG